MSKPELDDIAAAAGVDGGERVDEGVSVVVSASEMPKGDPALAHACRMVGRAGQNWALDYCCRNPALEISHKNRIAPVTGKPIPKKTCSTILQLVLRGVQDAQDAPVGLVVPAWRHARRAPVSQALQFLRHDHSDSKQRPSQKYPSK